jgi:tetratricopeptide (TPR) repeat protein/tRNA A-37 threonylcarbamoyl transferase component Bud32
MAIHLGDRFQNPVPIGSGGMGEVYRAYDRWLDRDVAIKVLKNSRLSNPNAHERFKREGLVVAKLKHPHIVPLHDVVRAGDLEFLVMEYIDGESLAVRLQRGPLKIDDVIKWGSQIAQAIAAVHRAEFTHRDLKPSNVMITESGAKLIDFGLAKLDNSDPSEQDQADSTATANLTHAGAVVGTLRYMSPEALERRTVDARSDVFSFGAVLYEMVTGRRAFDGDSDAQVIAAILSRNPLPLRELRPDAPPELATLIATCLAKEPRDRWQHALDVAHQLDAIPGSHATTRAPISSTTLRLARAQPRWVAAATIVGAIGVATPGDFYTGRMGLGAGAVPPLLVALPCEANDRAARGLCNGLADAVVRRLARLTQTHPLQVTPQVGGPTGVADSVTAARRLLGASRVMQMKTADGQQWTLTMADERPDTVPDSLDLESGDDGIFDLEERAVLWAVRTLGLEPTPVEREALLFRGTVSPGARTAYLRGRGVLVGGSDAAESDEGIAAFESAIADDPNYAASYAGLGMVWRAKYLRSHDPAAGENARRACADAIDRQPGLSEGYTCLGLLEAADKRFELAAASFARAIEADPTDDDAIVGLGRAQEDLHLPAEAERVYRSAIDQRPNYFGPRVWAANFYRRQNRYEDAGRALSEAVRLVPDNARLRAALAVPLMYVGRYEEAIAAARAAVEIEPTEQALLAWGMTLYRMRKFPAAAEMIERATLIGRPQPTVLGSLARAYYWWGTPDAKARAKALFTQAAAEMEVELLHPSGRVATSDLHISLSEYYAKLGRVDEAKRHLAQVGIDVDAKDSPTDSHQLLFVAMVYEQLGEHQLALRWLERAVFWGVKPSELRAWRELDGLRNDREFQKLISSN